MRLGRGVVGVGIVREPVMTAAVIELGGTDGCADGSGRCDRCLGGALVRPVGLCRGQGEHRTGARLLCGAALGRCRQGTAPAPGRLAARVLVGGVLRTGLPGGSRGQRGRQRVLLASAAPCRSAGHALRRHRPAQTGAHGSGTHAVLARHDDGTLGDTVPAGCVARCTRVDGAGRPRRRPVPLSPSVEGAGAG